jgi:SAM-dependent methyltransferase/glycosyltransferase involved in cell wall biosynthesis
MRLIGIAMIKNERDIVEAFVRHNLQFLDAILMIDNCSSDGTREILENLLKEGKPIVIFDEPEFAYFQSERITKFCLNICRFFSPDFVFVLDADEFIKASSRDFLEHYLTFLPSDNCGVIPWHTYVLNLNDDPSISNPIQRIKHRCKQEYPAYYKCLIPRSILAREDYVINQGNHFVYDHDGNMLQHGAMLEIAIAHYPVRSPIQIAQKVLNGWLAYVAKNPDSKDSIHGFFWYRIYQRLMQNPILSNEETVEISLKYAQMNPPENVSPWDNFMLDPLNLQIDLVYTPEDNLPLTIAVIKNFEAFLTSKSTVSLPFQPQPNHPLYLDIPPLKFIFDKYSSQSILDLGCNQGEYLAMFQKWGVTNILGIDVLAQTNLSASLNLAQKFDLVLCINLMAYISPDDEANVLSHIDRYAEQLILFSAPEPGQIGDGYINCQPLSYWLSRWQTWGWQPIVFDTLAIRSLATFVSWRRNPVLLARTAALGETSNTVFNIADLQRIERRAIAWSLEPPNTYAYPLSQPLRSLECDGAAP